MNIDAEKSQTIFRIVKRESPFVQIDKHVFEDPNLSFKAKGILGYLLSRPDNWSANVTDLINHSPDGEYAVRSGLKELIQNGYVVRRTERDEKKRIVRFVLEVYEEPFRDFLQVENRGDLFRDFLHVGNRDVNNNDLNNIKTPPTSDEREIQLVAKNRAALDDNEWGKKQYSALTFAEAEALYRKVRPNQFTLPRSDKFENAVYILLRYLELHKRDLDKAAEALRPFAREADRRGISPLNLCWLSEWAAAGEIPLPSRKNGNGGKNGNNMRHEPPPYPEQPEATTEEIELSNLHDTIRRQVIDTIGIDELRRRELNHELHEIYQSLFGENELYQRYQHLSKIVGEQHDGYLI